MSSIAKRQFLLLAKKMDKNYSRRTDYYEGYYDGMIHGEKFFKQQMKRLLNEDTSIFHEHMDELEWRVKVD